MKNLISIPKIFIIFFISCFFYLDYVLFEKQVTKINLSWDEVNYALSAEKGFIENLFETNSSNFIQFVNLGYLKLKKETNIEKFKSINLVEENEDVFFLRHFHPPLSSLYWSLFVDNNIEEQDKKLRNSLNFLIYFIISILLLVSIYYNLNNLTIKILFIFILFNSNLISVISNNLNFHLLFSLTSLIYLVTFINLLKNNNLINKITFSFSIVFLLMSLESALFIIFGSFVTLFIYFKKFNLNFKSIFFVFFLSVFLIFILWPSNFLNLTILKTYFMYAYRIIFQSNIEYSEVSQFNIFSDILFNDYFLILFFILFLIFILINYKKALKFDNFFITFIHGLIYFIIIFPFIYHPNYIIPAVLIFALSFIYFLNDLEMKIKFDKIIFLPIILFVFLIYFYNNNLNNSYSSNIIDLTVKDIYKHNQNKPILVDGSHIFKYYSKYNKIDNLNINNPHEPEFYVRENYNNFNVMEKIKDNFYSMIILQKDRKYNSEQFNLLIKYGYYKYENEKYNIFIVKK